MKLVFATNNSHKISEIRAALPSWFTIVTLEEAGVFTDIPEPHDTLEENAAEKARTIFALTGTDCFSEDTGLEVPALGNEPGVHSARYAGEERSSQKNIEKLLSELEGKEDRQARFRTVICLLLGNKEYFFEGICRGRIISGQKGQEGFGYDPVFVPEGSDRTFAEMGMEEKNRFSHRKKALDNLVVFLNNMDINQ